MTNTGAKQDGVGPRRTRTFIADLATTFVTVALTSISSIIVIRLVAGGLGPDEFGAYSLSRRVLSTVASISMLGMGLAIPRELALATDQRRRNQIVISGTVLSLGPLFLILTACLYPVGGIAAQLFHDDLHESLTRMTLALIASYAGFSLLYAYYRGIQQVGIANGWQLALSGIAPIVVAITLAPVGRADLVTGAMAATMAISFIPVVIIFLAAFRNGGPWPEIADAGRTLLRYGVPRIPSGFAAAALFAIGPFLAPRFGTLRDAGYLAAGQSILGILEGGLAAFGIIALPKIAQMVGAGRHADVGKAVDDLLAMVVHLGLFTGIHAVIWAPVLVALVLGPEYADAVGIMRLVLLALVPYLAFVLLRSVVDAVEERPVNTLNLFAALGITLIVGVGLALGGFGARGLATGTTVGIFFLGVRTASFLRHRLGLVGSRWQLGPVSLANVVLAGAAFVAEIVSRRVDGAAQIGMVAGVEAVLIVVYVYVLVALKVDWLQELRRRALVAFR